MARLVEVLFFGRSACHEESPIAVSPMGVKVMPVGQECFGRRRGIHRVRRIDSNHRGNSGKPNHRYPLRLGRSEAATELQAATAERLLYDQEA